MPAKKTAAPKKKPTPPPTASDYAKDAFMNELDLLRSSSPIMRNQQYLDNDIPVIEDEAILNSEIQNLLSIHNPQTRKVRAIACVELIKKAVLTNV